MNTQSFAAGDRVAHRCGHGTVATVHDLGPYQVGQIIDVVWDDTQKITSVRVGDADEAEAVLVALDEPHRPIPQAYSYTVGSSHAA